jgi:molybdate transport system substrate-binding protein
MPTRGHTLLALGIAVLIGIPRMVHSAEIKVLSDGPLEPALTQAAEVFHRESSHTVKFGFGLSPTIHKRVMDGEPADVVIIQPNFIDELVKAGKLAPGEHPIVARVGVGLFVRAGTATSDITTPEALKQALLRADALVFSNVAAGNYFATVLDRLGISETVKGKVTRASPADVVTRIVQGTGKDIGVRTITLILKDKRFLLLDLIPHGFHAAAAVCSRLQRNSVPSTHMRCRITASRRANATIAFFIPRRLAICMAQALSHDHFFERNMLCAAS